MTLINIQKKLEGGFNITHKFIKQLSCLLLLSINFISENAMSASKEFNLDNQIYKVLTLEEWERAQASGVIITDLDKKDGFHSPFYSDSTQCNPVFVFF
jgi:hypothetical protein